MNDQRIIGIGCYAKPEKLRRIFRRMVKDYTLGQVEDFDLLDAHGSIGKILLKALTSEKTDFSPCRRLYSGDTQGNSEVTGFFLTLRDQQLNLSIFSKGNGQSGKRYTADLGQLTKIRQKRLN
jgi:hypothetical protein